MLFGNNVLRGQYLRRGRQAQAFLDTTQQLELALDWMQEHRQDGRIRSRLMEWMVQICLRQFRIDILGSVRGEIREESREEALKGEVGFSKEYFDELMVAGVHLILRNRSDFKDVRALMRYLFDFDDGRSRIHWEDRPYRKMYRRAVTGVSVALGGREQGRRLAHQLYEQLFALHWILPYPCAEVLLQTTKAGARMWYSVVAESRIDTEGREQKKWVWGRKAWQEGRPRERAEWLDWTQDEWMAWIERTQRPGTA